MTEAILGNEAAVLAPQRSRWLENGQREEASAARWQRPLPRPLHKARPTGWSSSLSEGDLACLLQVIESQVLPRLLQSYRPADRSPLRAGDPV